MITKEKLDYWKSLKNKADIVTISGLAPSERLAYETLTEEFEQECRDISGEILEEQE